MRNIIVGGFLLIFVGFYACREDFDFDPASQELGFSTDTISIDTVFTQFNSETFAFRVYNRQDKDVLIPRIYLGRGANSFYKINVDGEPGFDFTDVAIRANDSIFVFVEMAIPDATTQQYEDDIFFETNATQSVKLLSWIEETTYYVPENGSDEVEITDAVWDNNTVKFIAGTGKVMNDLTVEAGTKVYFFSDAGLEIQSGNSLTVNGTLNDKVIFRGHGHTARKDSLPDQWNRILLKENATANLNYTRIKGGDVGLQTESGVNLTLTNTEIYNNQSFGLLLNNTTVDAENVVINNSNQASIAILSGGTYDFNHSTIANYFDLDAGPTLSLFMSNTNDENITQPLNATFTNSIFYGRAQNAVRLDNDAGAAFNYTFNNCVVRNNITSDLDVNADSNFINPITENPNFINIDFGVNNLRLETEDSSAQGTGNATFAAQTPIAFDGNSRLANPDIGAYQD